MRLNGLHHITAITGDARRNLDFYTGTLGLRLTAKTVNQDDPSVYHLFYGEEEARPGLDLTFFEYPGATPGRPGAGMVHRILWRVGSRAALAFWAERLVGHEVAAARGEGFVRFADPEGLEHELVLAGTPDAPLVAEHPEIPAALALQGFEGVRAYSARPERSARTLTELMGAAETEPRVFTLRGETRGGWIAWDPAPAEPGRPGAGTVHHVAWGTKRADYDGWLERLAAAGVRNSGPVDRHYFESIYFREPGGVLYELATKEPGFLVDGLPVEKLGTKVVLPPWLEARREEIEARLTPLPDPRRGGRGRSAARAVP